MVDGLHIRCLWIAYCYKYHKQLIENGHVYISVPPLYLIEKKQSNKVFKYAYSDEEKEQIVLEYGGYQNVSIQRYKGLNHFELAHTCLTSYQKVCYRI